MIVEEEEIKSVSVRRILFFIFVFFSTFKMSWAEGHRRSIVPFRNEPHSSSPWLYQGLKYGYFDLDEILMKYLGIEFQKCEYLSQLKGEVIVQEGMGPCIYRLLVESLSSPSLAGVVQAKGIASGREAWVHVFANFQVRSKSGPMLFWELGCYISRMRMV